ncbi:D-xylose ABC transporter ATP-binding protein [candidate division KSB3 bacterium]|uniref:D-xylose ABC transporter ATP-binding protein n=1 Tax=candidate division KSB3 bacterium TaxID=2044937 RepID=A0A2G6K922_9BACT|nr:MAG: D-xylose ABC transporter ATP-binding protein [candidate division KSB3 bacterium]
MDDNILLEVKNVSKTFPGVRALDKVKLTLRKGTVHALCGENGAGKSTLMHVLMGVYRKDDGEILFKGHPVDFRSPRQALAQGISIVEQELSPIPDMTVAENLFLGREPVNQKVFVKYAELNAQASRVLQDLNLNIDPTRKMRTLSLAETQLVEIAKALSYNSDVIIMDEPTSAIGDKEVDRLFSVITRLKKQDKGIIYVSHRLEEIFTIADEVTVLRDGKYISTEKTQSLDRAKLISLMIGRKMEEEFVKNNIPADEALLVAKNFTKAGQFKNIHFALKKGEVLGIFGLMGSGRSEFLHALFGVESPDRGELFLNGAPVQINKPSDAIEHGIAYVTEDRKETGLVLTSSVKENISLTSLKRLTNLVLLNSRQEQQDVTEMVERFRVKTPSLRQLVVNLSGGNQQKVVLGKWLLTHPKILLFDEPTRGIDVGAKREIYNFISDYTNQGSAVIMVSSELPEIIGMSDRILVFRRGELAGELRRGEATQESIMHLAV